MKRLISILLVLCLLGSCSLFAYAAEIDREFNTEPGSITPEGQYLLDIRPTLQLLCWIFGGLLVLAIGFLIYSIVAYLRSEHKLFAFRQQHRLVQPVATVYISAKISIAMVFVEVILPILLLVVAYGYTKIHSLDATLLTCLFIFLHPVPFFLSMELLGIVGLLLAIVGIVKSRRKALGIVACSIHGAYMLCFLAASFIALVSSIFS